jgi:hypothetical protein
MPGLPCALVVPYGYQGGGPQTQRARRSSQSLLQLSGRSNPASKDAMFASLQCAVDAFASDRAGGISRLLWTNGCGIDVPARGTP